MKRIGVIVVCIAFLPAACERPDRTAASREPLKLDARLPATVQSLLDEAGWPARVGDGLGLWVSVGRQRLVVVEGNRVAFVHVCSTAARGTGNQADSYQTPLGWHEIDERFGEEAAWGAVFKERCLTGEVWRPGGEIAKDLILSRILWLRGLEPGVNSGPGIDSHARYIYIHGTPAEDKLGTPASHGCIRLSNDDVIALYQRAPSGTPVFITEW